MIDSTERNCDKCIHHINGYCDSWDCNMQTVEDVKKEAVNEYVKVVVEELEQLADESYKAFCIAFNSDDRAEYDAYTNAIEIVKGGGVDAGGI